MSHPFTEEQETFRRTGGRFVEKELEPPVDNPTQRKIDAVPVLKVLAA